MQTFKLGFALRNMIIKCYIFRDALKQYDYVKIRSQRLQGLVLNVFCLRKHLTHLRLMETQYTKTGFGGMWVREKASAAEGELSVPD